MLKILFKMIKILKIKILLSLLLIISNYHLIIKFILNSILFLIIIFKSIKLLIK